MVTEMAHQCVRCARYMVTPVELYYFARRSLCPDCTATKIGAAQ